MVVTLVTDRVERLAPGLGAARRPTAPLEVARRPSRSSTAGSSTFDGVAAREAAEALHGAVLSAEPLDDPDALWVHELIGAEVRRRPTAGTWGRVASVQDNPASDLLVLDAGALVPVVFVVDARTPAGVVVDPPDGPARRDASEPVRIDVFTIFPAMVDDFADQSLLGKARAAGLLDVRVHDLRSATTDPHRSVDDAPFGGGAGMVLMPEPLFAAVEAVDPPRPLLLLGPGGRRLDQAVRRASWPPATGSRCCAAATRASTSGCASTSSTASCRSATTCWPAARWRRWSCSRRSAGSCPA